MICHDCNETIQPTATSPGYGKMADGAIVCFKCCANRDREYMRANGSICLYLTSDASNAPNMRICNWPGTLEFRVLHGRKGRHNIGRVRRDVWFLGPDGKPWHGVNIGDNDVLRCKRVQKMP